MEILWKYGIHKALIGLSNARLNGFRLNLDFYLGYSQAIAFQLGVVYTVYRLIGVQSDWLAISQ